MIVGGGGGRLAVRVAGGLGGVPVEMPRGRDCAPALALRPDFVIAMIATSLRASQ